MRFVLASASPRRLELLKQITSPPIEMIPANIDEAPRKKENPRCYVKRMAHEKAYAIDHELPVLAADTAVICGRRILGQPQSAKQAREMLLKLSGRRHKVITCVALKKSSKIYSRHVETKVKFKPLTAREVDFYLESGEWKGKAGAYAIQGLAGSFVSWIQGSYSAVVGLPLYETASLLREHA